VALVQFATTSDSDQGTLAYDTNVAANNLGVLFTRIGGTSTNSGVTDSLGSTWALVRRVSQSTNFNIEMWWTVFGSSGANTVTTGGGSIGRVQIAEYNGLGAGAVLDQHNGATNTGTAADSGAITTTAAGWLFAGLGVNSYPSVDVTNGAGWTNMYKAGIKGATEYRAEGSAGTFNGTFTLPESNDWAAIVASFKAAGGGGSTLMKKSRRYL
jgi:hypothetical protein